jgi:hypothetical protein
MRPVGRVVPALLPHFAIDTEGSWTAQQACTVAFAGYVFYASVRRMLF